MIKVSPEQQQRMKTFGVHPAEFEESFVRSSGRGGQNVNKVSTCVQLTHLPTGFSVKCMVHRTQAKNRHEALLRLLEKIDAHRKRLRRDEKQAREKLRRKTRPRPSGVKRRILADKRHQSEKKDLRKKVDPGKG